MESYVEAQRAAAGRTFDVAAPANDSGVAMLAVRKNAATPLANADGDYTPLQTDSTGALRITGSVSAASAGPYVVDSAFAGTHTGMPAFAVRKDVPDSLADDGDYTPLQTDASGALRITPSYASNNSFVVFDNGFPAFAVRKDIPNSLADDGNYTPLQTDSTGALRVSSACSANNSFVAGDCGFPAFAVRKNTAAAIVGTDNSYTPLQTDGTGYLRVIAAGATTAGAPHNPGTEYGAPVFAVRKDSAAAFTGVSNGGYTPLQTDANGALRVITTGTVTAAGPYAADAAFGAGHTGMPAFAVQKTTAASLVGADGDYTPLQTDANGALRVNPGSSALNSAVALSASAINVKPLDFGLMVQRGLYTDMSFINVYGRNTNAAMLTIWPLPTSYSTPTGAQLLNVVSNNSNDSSGGIGARTVFIEGLDGNYDIVSETITMNGMTTVVTTNQYIALNNVYVATAGSTQWAEGTITFTQQSSGQQLAAIRANINVAESAVYTVPRGYTAFINELFITGFNTTSNTTCHVVLQTKTSSGVFLTQALIILTGNLVNHLDKRFSAPIVAPEQSVIMFRSIAANGGGTWDVAVNFGVFLVLNS